MESHQSSEDAIPISSARDADETVGQIDVEPGEPQLAPASTIGRYVVLDLLGVGGMGVVCTAYDPKLDRKVALKLLRERAAGEEHATQGQARLLREAQALAKLSHPNIITVHDVDTYDGQLYMAMEFVEGSTIKEWIHAQKRPWPEIIEVFLAAGRGLAAAHETGITHRDFKPANVLMGDDGRVRVVDFGLAKGREDRDLEAEVEKTTGRHRPVTAVDSGIIDMMRSISSSDLTQVGRSVGTPAYMAPEQHMGFGVGPHTDQFSFCVALYEALYGHLPFTGDTIEERFQAMVEERIIEPPRDAQVPAWIHRALLRGLRSQAADRYPNMEALLTVLARDPARRRRRIALTAGALGLAGLGAVGVVQANAAQDQMCRGAEERLDGIWDDDRRQAVRAAFAATNRPYADDAWARVSQALDEYTTEWTSLHARVCTATHVRGEQSEALLDVRMACLARRLDQVNALVDVYADADAKVVEKAPSSIESLVPATDCATAEQVPEKQRMPDDPAVREQVEDVQKQLAVVQARVEGGKVKDALPLAVDVSKRADELPHLPTRAEALMLLAQAQKASSEIEAAEESYHRAIRMSAASEQAESEASAWINLVHLVGYRQRKSEQGLAWALPAEAALARLEDPEKFRHRLVNNIASVHFGQGDYPKAEELYREALDLASSAYGEDSVRTSSLLGNLASSLGAQGKHAEAEAFARKAAELDRLRYGSSHPNLAGTLINLGHILSRLDRDAEASEIYEETLAIREQSLPPDHPAIADSLSALAGANKTKGQMDEALVQYTRALAIFREALPPDHPKLTLALNNLGRLEQDQEQYEQALVHHREALEIAAKRLKKDHPHIAATQRHICSTLRKLARFDEALAACDVSLEIYEKGSDKAQISTGLYNRALVLIDLRRENPAITDLRRALTTLADREAQDETSDGANVRFLLAKTLWSQPANRGEALEHANDARVIVAALEDSDRQQDIESWLAAHRLP